MSPGIVPGLAPAAPEAPPASTGHEGRSPSTGKTFADTVADRRAAQDAADRASTSADPGAQQPEPAAQGASEPNAPPGDPTADSASTEAAGLLALVRDLLAADADATTETASEAPLLDRPTGAGDAETEIDVHAMEALMAQSLLMRTAAPDEDVTIAPIAVVATPVDASGGEAASALDGLRQAITGLADAGTATAITDASVPASIDVPAGLLADGLDALPATQPAAEGQAISAAPPADAAQPVAMLAADDVQEALGVPLTLPVESESTTAGATGEEAPAGASTAGQAEQPFSGMQAARDAASATEGDEPEMRRVRVSDVTAGAMPQAQPVQGESLAATAEVTRVEVATGGAVTSQIANTVQSAVLRGEHEVRLVLNPPELGRVEITIVESDGGIRVQMLADHPGARDLIERQLPLLQQALAARDVRVDRLEVGRSGDAASAEQWSDARGSNDGQRQRGQQDGQWNESPDWSPLAAMGMGLTDSVRAGRPMAVVAGGLDVMA